MNELGIIFLGLLFLGIRIWFSYVGGKPPHENALIKLGQGVAILAVLAYFLIVINGWKLTLWEAKFILTRPEESNLWRPAIIIVIALFVMAWIYIGYYWSRWMFDPRLLVRGFISLAIGIALLYYSLNDVDFWRKNPWTLEWKQLVI